MSRRWMAPPWAKAAERPVAGLKPQDVASVSEHVAETERTADTPDLVAWKHVPRALGWTKTGKVRKVTSSTLLQARLACPPG
jgi:hypothetical protein